MRVPLSWLAEFVPVAEGAEALAERLTRAGIEVEAVERVGDLDRRIVVGRVARVAPHPQADRLAVCDVDVGTGAPVTIVSGAPGLRAGRRVAVALPGARRPDGRVVEAVTLRGIASTGVLCSEAELGLGDDEGALLALPATARAGTPLGELPGVADAVLALAPTPNRADCLSILGVAREVAALTGARLVVRRTRLVETGAPAGDAIGVRIDAPDLCARYCARVVRGVRVGPSPLSIRLRLRRAGMRPLNAVVDATNYVMLERGQPLHAFDLGRLGAPRIVVRRATRGETIVTLDGVTRTLDVDDLVVTDGRTPVAIAGVMGGAASEVRDDTTDLLLESAFFAPGSVRRTARRLALASQAAYRFERRVDPAMVAAAIDRVAALVVALAGGTVAPGVVEDRGSARGLDPVPVRVRPRRVAALLGMEVSRATVVRHVRRLGATVRPDGDALVVTPPSWRGDLTIEEDLVEEVARLEGYDRLPTSLPRAPMAGGVDSPARDGSRRVRALLVAEGLAEAVTWAFTDAETNRRVPGAVGGAVAPVVLANPLSSELAELRRSPLAGLVRAIRLNQGHGAPFVGLFEIGKGYGRAADGTHCEPRVVAMALAGAWPPCGAERTGPPVGFLDLKGIVTNLLAGLGWAEADVRLVRETGLAFLHPGKSVRLMHGERSLGVVGGLHPETAQVCDLTGEIWLAELDFEGVVSYRPPRVPVRAVPRFPAVTRDIAVVVDEAFPADEILEELRALADPLIESARVFDCYRGEPVPAGKKSLAYTIAYRAAERTLTDEEVNTRHERLRAHLAARVPGELRS